MWRVQQWPDKKIQKDETNKKNERDTERVCLGLGFRSSDVRSWFRSSDVRSWFRSLDVRSWFRSLDVRSGARRRQPRCVEGTAGRTCCSSSTAAAHAARCLKSRQWVRSWERGSLRCTRACASWCCSSAAAAAARRIRLGFLHHKINQVLCKASRSALLPVRRLCHCYGACDQRSEEAAALAYAARVPVCL